MDVKKAIVKTLYYSSLFQFPLTKAELWKYCIAKQPITFKRWQKELEQLSGSLIAFAAPYYVLHGQNHLITMRKKRFAHSQKKLQQHLQLLRLLSSLPTVRLLAISGSLARLNANKNADIDLFIITTKRTLWITRLLLLGLLQLTGKRRRYGQKKTKNTICLNMLLDEAHLHFGKQRQDLYTGYEICQLRVIVDKNYTYQHFLSANSWIQRFLPHFWQSTLRGQQRSHSRFSYLSLPFQLVEPLARSVQLFFIRRHQTAEIAGVGIAAFHPLDYRRQILHKMSQFEANSSLWDIDKQSGIHYTRKDHIVSPVIFRRDFILFS